jgi:phosphoglycerate kinase
MPLLTVDAMAPEDLAERIVLVRIDGNDEFGLRDTLPTLSYLSEAKARAVIATHCGTPTDEPHVDELTAKLSEMLGRPVGRLDDWRGEAGLRAVSHMAPGDILVMENLALEAGDTADDKDLAEALSRLTETFCNEAFGLAHEARASTTGITKRVRQAFAGIAFGRQWKMLEVVLGQPRPPSLTLLGGEASRDKLLLAEEIAQRSDETLIGGQLALPFLVARKVIRHHPAVTDEMLVISDRIMSSARQKRRQLSTPVDFTVVDEKTFARLRRGEVLARPDLRNLPERDIGDGQVIADIGTATRWAWSDRFGPARTIFWHGPMGVCEINLFCAGSRFLATAMAERTWPTLHRAFVCGASLVDGLRACGFSLERLRYLTRHGRPALHYRAGRPLPAVEVLQRAGAAAPSPSCVLIPLNGSERDAVSLHAVAELTARDAEIVLLHVRPGPDEDKYADLVSGLNRAEKLERQLESERIFSRANAQLASRGLLSHRQLAVQGKPTEMILRYAERLDVDMIVVAAASGLNTIGWRRVVDGAPCAAIVARPH